MIINVHAGHNPAGKIACGAVGLLNESEQARIVKDKVISLLRNAGQTVYDCTVDNGTSQNDVLRKIVTKCNSHSVDLDVSIHFNSGAKDKVGNGKTSGSEVYIYKTTSKAKDTSQRIVNNLVSLGFRNRGVKTSTSLYYLKKVKAPALLIEVCFVDDRDDCNLYNADKVAMAIANGILNTKINTIETSQNTTANTNTTTNTAVNNSLIKIGLEHAKNFTGVDDSGNLSKAKVRTLQRGLNLDYGKSISEDGIIGTKTKTKLGRHYIAFGEKQYMVTVAEILMYLNGIDPSGLELPGKYGNGLVRAAQKKFGGVGTKITAENFLTLVK